MNKSFVASALYLLFHLLRDILLKTFSTALFIRGSLFTYLPISINPYIYRNRLTM